MSLISVVNGWKCDKCGVVKNSTTEFWNDGCDCPADQQFNKELKITFEASKMERFIKKESLLAMVFKDLSARNKKNPKEDILETIFNSYVLDDSVMVREYNKA